MTLNKDYIGYNLTAAARQIEMALGKLQDEQTDEDDFAFAMNAIYSYLNIAWHARHSKMPDVLDISNEQLQQWRQFPTAQLLVP